jgi:hypothetical protein
MLTVGESGMYFCAANLVCLRPLYGKLPQFIRDRFAMSVGGTRDVVSKSKSGLTRSRFWPTRHSHYPSQNAWTNIEQGPDPWTHGSPGTYDVEATRLSMLKGSSASMKADSETARHGEGEINIETTVDISSVSGLCDPKEDSASSSRL